MKTFLLRFALLIVAITASIPSLALSSTLPYSLSYSSDTYDYNPANTSSTTAIEWTITTLRSDIYSNYNIGTEQFDSNYSSDQTSSSAYKQYIKDSDGQYKEANGSEYIGNIRRVVSVLDEYDLKVAWSVSNEDLQHLFYSSSSSTGTHSFTRVIRFRSYNSSYQDLYVELTLNVNFLATSKVETPTISYTNGRLDFNTSTSGAEIVSEVTVEDAKKSYTSSVNLTQTYNITAYATKSGYEDSDVATATLVWATGTLTNGINEAKTIAVDTLPLLISQEEGMVTVNGLSDGNTIIAYDTDGKQVAMTKAAGNAALMNLSDLRGKIAVLCANGKSAKVMIK